MGTERRTGGTATDLFSGISGERLLISELSKSFGGIQALAGVSLEAKPGEITAIIGPNGSGKTTLLNLVAGFYRIQSGVIKVGQHSLNGLSAHAIALLGVVRTFQQPLVAEQMSVLDAVSIVRYGRNPVSILQSVFRSPRHFRAGREDAEIACAAIESVRLQSVSHVDAAALPLGTRRMTELARVIAAQPNAVLLDEIASGLDEGELEEMVSILRRMRAAGATILMVEHNLQLVMSLADQVYVLAQGRVVLAGSPDEVKASPILEAELLGTRTARPDVDDAAPQSDSVQVEQ